MGQVKLPATVAEKHGVGSGNLGLMGEALGQSRDELIEQRRISEIEILQADKP